MIRFEAPQWIGLPRSELEELLKLPPVLLRVYLYGLVHSDADLAQMGADLGVASDKLLAAIDSLQERGFLRVEIGSRSRICYTVRERGEESAPELYADSGFNDLLCALFGERELSYSELRRIYEFIEIYELPKPVVLVLVELCINTHPRKNRLPIKSIEDRAREWAKAGINTVALANRRMSDEMAPKLGCRDVLALMGIYRYPTAEEKKLYAKWTAQWGFTYSGIAAAMSATTRASWPSMKYLDSILEGLYKKGITDDSAISRAIQAEDTASENIKQLMSTLGSPRRVVTPEQREYYEKWSRMGFSCDAMALACRQAYAAKSASFEFADALLCGWHARGLRTAEAIASELEAARALRKKTADMLKAAGVSKAVSEADIKQYSKFSQAYGMPDELILFAAECAFGLSAPQRAIEKILKGWHEAGAHTLDAAKAERERFQRENAAGRSENRAAPAQKSERNYDDLAGFIRDYAAPEQNKGEQK